LIGADSCKKILRITDATRDTIAICRAFFRTHAVPPSGFGVVESMNNKEPILRKKLRSRNRE